MINRDFWKGKRVFITGHTGFKGSWMSLMLSELNSQIFGYSISPPTDPSLFEQAKISELLKSDFRGDIRDRRLLKNSLNAVSPDIVIHMAAQPLVRESYRNPADTYEINVMGTVNVLEAVRECPSVRAVVVVTTDKCYENKEWLWGYRENEPLGGYDPYSSSKAASELVTSAYRQSFFNVNEFGKSHHVALASARAGNVIGGGDYAEDRLIPDTLRSFRERKEVAVRNPTAIRPWQHVLEPLTGYLILAERLYDNGISYADAWNFGPNDNDAKPVGYIVELLCSLWGDGAAYKIDSNKHPHEARYLKLDTTKSRQLLDWFPAWNLDKTLESIVIWEKEKKKNHRQRSIEQINEYLY